MVLEIASLTIEVAPLEPDLPDLPFFPLEYRTLSD
jgi:hypothetical protein